MFGCASRCLCHTWRTGGVSVGRGALTGTGSWYITVMPATPIVMARMLQRRKTHESAQSASVRRLGSTCSFVRNRTIGSHCGASPARPGELRLQQRERNPGQRVSGAGGALQQHERGGLGGQQRVAHNDHALRLARRTVRHGARESALPVLQPTERKHPLRLGQPDQYAEPLPARQPTEREHPPPWATWPT